jgi:hypothetical protein
MLDCSLSDLSSSATRLVALALAVVFIVPAAIGVVRSMAGMSGGPTTSRAWDVIWTFLPLLGVAAMLAYAVTA